MKNDLSLAIVGGGLAGMAAAAAAARLGWRVALFERAKHLGGRAGSFHDPVIDVPVDFCRHAAMGCCVNFLDFCRQEELGDCFDRTDTLHLIDPAGRQRDFTPSRWLPHPLHLLPPLAQLGYLSIAERWNIVRAMRALVGWDKRSEVPPDFCDATQSWWGCASLDPPYKSGSAAETDETIGCWLRRHGQSERAIEQFWAVVLNGALSETVEHAALSAARQVFRTGFMGFRGASDLVLPRHSLKYIFHDRLSSRLTTEGVELHLGTTVRRIEGAGRRATALVLADGRRLEFDRFIVAVPWHRVSGLLSDELRVVLPGLDTATRNIPAGAIAAVHLWFDRPAVPQPHAVLVGHGGRWVFASPPNDQESSFPRFVPHCAGKQPLLSIAQEQSSQQYCQVVISAAHRLPDNFCRERALSRSVESGCTHGTPQRAFPTGIKCKKHSELLREVLDQLQSIWPDIERTKLLHHRVIVMPRAVFTCLPGVERLRPPQQTPLENLALAGDWTATDWPATMEGAVRSGQAAVEVLSGAFCADSIEPL